MPQNKDRQPFRGICHTDDDSYYIEITNGSISLCTNNDELEEEDFEQIVTGLNKYNCSWYSNNDLELQQHIEIMQLQDRVKRMADALKDIKEQVKYSPGSPWSDIAEMMRLKADEALSEWEGKEGKV